MAKKPNFVSSSIRERSQSKATTKPVALSEATKKNLAAYLASTGVGSSDGIPKYLRKPAAKSGVSGSAVGVGKNSPLTKTSLATNPKRALDSKEWKMAVEGAYGISDKNSAGANAALAAMAFLPVPGLRNIGKVAAGAGKVAATGKKAVTGTSRTAAENATIRKGMQNAKTPEVSAKIDAGNAKVTSTTPAKFGRAGEVEFRTPKPGDPKVATDARVSKFQKSRAEQQGGKRTAKEQKRYQEDLQNSLSIGARMRAEGRTPGLDVGGRGNAAPTLGSKAPAPAPKATPKQALRETAAAGLRKPLKPRNPGRAGSEAKQQRYKEGMAKYEKDLAAWEKRTAGMSSKTKAIDEGRLKPDGTPKGATAKSMARNDRNLAKKAGAEGPKKPAAAAKPKESKVPYKDEERGGIREEIRKREEILSGKRTSKSKALFEDDMRDIKDEIVALKDKLSVEKGLLKPNPRLKPDLRLKPDPRLKPATTSKGAVNKKSNVAKSGSEGPKKPAVSAARKPSSDVVRVPITRGQKASGPQVKGGRVIPLAPKRGKEIEVIRGKVLATRPITRPAAPAKGAGKGKKRLLGASAVLGATGVAGYAFQKSGAGKGKDATSSQGSEGLKRQVLTDKYGRQIGRAEYNRREKYRASIVGKTPKQVEKMRKAEAKRRLEFRETDGKKMFGALASKKSKNLDVPVGVSVRKKRQGPASPQNIRDRERFK